MEILASLEERFGGRFPEDVMPELETCRQVLEAVEMYLGSGQKKAQRQETAIIPAENYSFDKFPEYLKLKAEPRPAGRDRAWPIRSSICTSRWPPTPPWLAAAS